MTVELQYTVGLHVTIIRRMHACIDHVCLHKLLLNYKLLPGNEPSIGQMIGYLASEGRQRRCQVRNFFLRDEKMLDPPSPGGSSKFP